MILVNFLNKKIPIFPYSPPPERTPNVTFVIGKIISLFGFSIGLPIIVFTSTKLFRFFSIALTAIALCANFASCSNESDKIIDQEEKKMCTVKINVENIVNIEEQPMKRTESENNTDLYLIAVSKGSYIYSDIYAYGLFDNLNNITIQLVEGDTYSIQASAVKDAKNKIAGGDDLYANPFLAELTNSFVYENDDDFNQDWYFNPTLYRLKNNDSEIALIAPNLEVFIGSTIGNYVAEENGDPIAISFGRFSACSAEFKAVDMPTGYLKINISNKETNTAEAYTTEDIIVASENQSTFQYITFGDALYNSLQNDGVPCILNLTWVKDDNTEIPLIPAEVTFKRDTNYIITIKVDDSTTGTFNITPIPDYEFTSKEEIGIYGKPIPLSNN